MKTMFGPVTNSILLFLVLAFGGGIHYNSMRTTEATLKVQNHDLQQTVTVSNKEISILRDSLEMARNDRVTTAHKMIQLDRTITRIDNELKVAHRQKTDLEKELGKTKKTLIQTKNQW